MMIARTIATPPRVTETGSGGRHWTLGSSQNERVDWNDPEIREIRVAPVDSVRVFRFP